MFLRTRQGVLLLSATALMVVALVAWLAWPSGTAEPPQRERAYRDFTVCLLTDNEGLLGDPAKAAWAGMQSASVANSVRVQYLAISGAQTVENGLPYFNGLAQQKCAVIIAAGEVPVSAMIQGKGHFPDITYIAVGATTDGSVTTVQTSSADAVRTAVDRLVSDAARRSGGQ